ncbi:MAG: putative DNA-binding domain-containing protein [Blastocatellia bacterium]|nr:putative DNA-binding domain-containing protein [Blastocatellia bacterium]
MVIDTNVGLDRLQRWMQAVIIAPGSDEEAFRSNDAYKEIEPEKASQILLPSSTMSANERLHIYRRAYILRLVEVLAIDHATTKHLLGEEAFDDLMTGYVQAYPSRSYNLNFLNKSLPDYIKSLPKLARRDFIYDLIRLELAISEVFEEEPSPVLTKEAIASVPQEAWANAKLIPIKALRVLAFRYPVNAYLQSVRDKRDKTDPPKMSRKDCWVAVYRRDYSNWRLELSRPAYELLNAMVAGATIGEAVMQAMERASKSRLNWQENLFDWFREWVSQGMFQKIEY